VASAALGVEELRELAGMLAARLDGVVAELEEVGGMQVDYPRELVEHLEQRDALVRVLERLPEDLRARIRTMYVEEIGKVHRDDGYFSMPAVIGNDREWIKGTLEIVRCAGLRDPELWRAVRVELPSSWS
jgi:hypothetical protein